ncbi:MAG: glutamate--tRNA ligase [Clostridiales bacterium]|jgi:glutamyl-tRNA synthetase|nr:glutamate--tRNA ligase [Clostridiales bacterium]
MNKPIRTRFAPSPTGFLHMGSLRTALYCFLFTRKHGGTFILRIEDTDQERQVPGATEVIYNTLRDCGIRWDEGPDVGGPAAPYIQSQRKDSYLPYARELVESGHAYYCFCTREDLAHRRRQAEALGETWKYDKHCLHLAKDDIQAKLDAGTPYVIRQNTPATGESGFDDLVYGHIAAPNNTLDDMVLIKADGMPTYNFANVIDDHLMGISHVIRGMEYLSSTPKYNLLYKALGWEIPQYIHLPNVMRDSQHKLSKRDGDAYYSDFIQKGYLTEALINYLALVGWNPGDEREFFTMEELVEAFSVSGLSKSPAIFDLNKLTWFNAEYIRRLPFEDYLGRATPWFEQVLKGKGIDYRRLSELMQGRTEVFGRIPDMVRFLAETPDFDKELYLNKKQKSTGESLLPALKLSRDILSPLSPWAEEVLHDALMAGIQEAGMKNGTVLWPLRVAISGQASTPGGAIEIAGILGKEETLRRLGAAIEDLQKQDERNDL